MLDVITSGLTLAIVSPILVFLSEALITQGRRRRAYKRILKNPLVYEGVVLREIRSLVKDTPIVGRCTIKSIKVGTVTVEGDTWCTSFTGIELENLVPIVDTTIK